MNSWCIIALVIAGALSGPALGEGLLDQQLGGPSGPPAKPEVKSDNKPAAQPDRPVAPEMVDPHAAKAIDDQDLVRKLTNEGANGAKDDSGPGATMTQMIDRMSQSAQRLRGKDAGAITQETQRRIATDLDVMIEYARQQMSKGQSKPSPNEQQGQQRKMSQGNQQGNNSQGGTQAARSSVLPGGGARTPESNGTDIHQRSPQEWGNLPDRDRDLIFNGANEQYLPAYKDMIDRYYQALAEVGKNK